MRTSGRARTTVSNGRPRSTSRTCAPAMTAERHAARMHGVQLRAQPCARPPLPR